MSATKVVDQHGGDVITFVLDPDGVFERAEYPHPMVTVDRDTRGNVISISAVGRFTQPALQTYADWRRTQSSPEALVVKLACIENTEQSAPDEGDLLSIEGFDGGSSVDILVGPDDLVEQLSVGDRAPSRGGSVQGDVMGRRERLKEIWNCFYFGLLPSPFYEDNPHYECGYFMHLGMNMKYAWHLVRGGDIEP